jgi:uncharacterized protein
MKPLKSNQWMLALALSAAAALPAWAGKVSMETATANSVVGLMPQSMASVWAKAGVDVELAMGQTLTKSLLKVGQGNLDTAVMPPPAYANLVKGAGPYAKMGDKASALAANVRGMWGFSASNYHPIVWADSGIDNWSQIKGKRVYIGPPAGAANAQIKALIKVASGYEEGKDYEGIKAPWGVAAQSYKDGQFDLLVLPAALGSQALTEMALTRSIRILPMPAGAKPPAALGMVAAQIPKGTYQGQVNNTADIPTWQTVMMVVANKDLSEDLVYTLTKTYADSRVQLAKGNALLKELPGDDLLSGVIAPLHAGAARYYKEAGIAIPADLMPR